MKFKKIFSVLFVFIFAFNFTYAQNLPSFIPTNLYLKFGGNNSFIEKLQGFINNYYNAGLKTNGIFGSDTKDKVIEFQKSQGLTPDGVAGPKTIDKINQISNNPSNSDNSVNKSSDSSQNIQTNTTSEDNSGQNKDSANSLDLNKLQQDNKNNSNSTTANEKCGGPRLICTGKATIFNHASIDQKCIRDKNDQGFGGLSASGVKLGAEGKPGIPAVALPNAVKAKVPFGTSVEVLNVSNGICKSFPFLDLGPSNAVLSTGVVIDLTGSAYDELTGKKNCDKLPKTLGNFTGNIPKVKYYVSVTGEKLSPGQVGGCSHLK